MRLLTISIVLMFCLGITPNLPSGAAGNELEYYKRTFFLLLGDDSEAKNIGVGFKALDGDVIGTCYMNPFHKEKTIVIDPAYFERNSHPMKEALMFHELGHCALGRDHVVDFAGVSSISTFFDWVQIELGLLQKNVPLADGCPSTIMTEYILPEKCYIDNYFYYLKELFKGR